MSALSDLQKKLEQEAQGIMFPFSANANTVSTTQNVYDSATDGIMTMQGQKYVGPDAVIQYGTEEQDYQRQLKQIEAPMLPQFDETQFPKAGEGIMQTPTPAPTPPTTPAEPEAPAIDPCPPGFEYDPVKKMCVPIEQPKGDRDEPIKIDPRRNIGDVAKGLGVATDALNEAEFQKNPDNYNKDVDLKIDNNIPWLNFIPLIGKPLNMYLKGQSDKQLKTLGNTEGISVTENQDGTLQLKITNDVGKRNFARLQTQQSLAGNMASTQKLNAAGTGIEKAPNGQNMIVGPLTLDYFGKGNLFQPTTRTPAETDALNAEEKNKLLSELDAALGLDSTATTSKPVTVDPESTAADAEGGAKVKLTGATEPVVFGELEQVKQFGQLVRDNFTSELEIKAALDAIKQYETLYETGRINFGERDSEIERQKDKIEEATKLKQETDKQIEEADLGDSIPRQDYNKNDTAQERRFKEKVEEKRIQNEVKKFQTKQKTKATKPDKARAGERLTLRL